MTGRLLFVFHLGETNRAELRAAARARDGARVSHVHLGRRVEGHDVARRQLSPPRLGMPDALMRPRPAARRRAERDLVVRVGRAHAPKRRAAPQQPRARGECQVSSERLRVNASGGRLTARSCREQRTQDCRTWIEEGVAHATTPFASWPMPTRSPRPRGSSSPPAGCSARGRRIARARFHPP
ncbi:hypothetical protein SAMN02910314_01643 [Denitrobacterium detoxificans]|uniref:Uncharacterized protein n=1 Tax=Denitrobacterium detoxificans TaxID=79604 RepID=A0A1H8TME5_9ACTN|nr:hypothetical protein SAMN02910314_01643 [Denitrobacterium detoxificans]